MAKPCKTKRITDKVIDLAGLADALPAPARRTKSRKSKQLRAQQKAYVKQWHLYWGEGKLENWQLLCADLGLSADVSSLTKCKKALKGVNVNIFDFLDAKESQSLPPPMFASWSALKKYTFDTQRIFPAKEAKKAGPLAGLLKKFSKR